jgi:CubicO group peptidase (beta-lactamase class C family)
MKIIALGVALLGAVSFTASAAQQPLAGIDRYIEQVRADWKNVGAAVAIVQGSKTIYLRGFGVREHGKTAAVDPDTLFEIGSATKAFTTTALAMLVEEGKIGWDDPIVAHLPAFQLQDPWLTRHLTIRDAIAHRTGVGETLYPFLGIMTADQAIEQLRYVTADARFRDSYRYNNLMYAVAGKVIEAASGMSYGEFIKQRVLLALDMKRSGVSAYDFWDPQYVAPTYLGSAPAGHATLTDSRDPNVAMPHGLDRDGSVIVLPWQSFASAAPAGAVVSSAADMANWLILHLNDGHFAGRELLKKETMQELHAVQNVHVGSMPPGVTPEGYAMGWRRGRYLGHVFLEHGGHMLGFPSYMALLPESRIGIVVLSNGPEIVTEPLTKFHQTIALWAFARLLGEQPDRVNPPLAKPRLRAVSETSTSETPQPDAQSSAAPLPLDQYAGAYENRKEHSGRVNVRVANGQLLLAFAGDGAFSASLEPWRGDLFRLHSITGIPDPLGLALTNFLVDACGRVVGLTVDSPGLEMRLDKLDSSGGEDFRCGMR